MTSVDPYIKFGKHLLNKQNLEKNILQIKTQSKTNNPLGKRFHISDHFKDLLFDILHTHKINVQTQKNLDTGESQLFEKLLHKCMLLDYLNYKPVTKDVSDYVHRFNILRGAIIAGNHSREVLNEIRDIVKLLSNPTVNKINNEDATDILGYIDYIDHEAFLKEKNNI